jgi:hypothetical protein
LLCFYSWIIPILSPLLCILTHVQNFVLPEIMVFITLDLKVGGHTWDTPPLAH